MRLQIADPATASAAQVNRPQSLYSASNLPQLIPQGPPDKPVPSLIPEMLGLHLTKDVKPSLVVILLAVVRRFIGYIDSVRVLVIARINTARLHALVGSAARGPPDEATGDTKAER